MVLCSALLSLPHTFLEQSNQVDSLNGSASSCKGVPSFCKQPGCQESLHGEPGEESSETKSPFILASWSTSPYWALQVRCVAFRLAGCLHKLRGKRKQASQTKLKHSLLTTELDMTTASTPHTQTELCTALVSLIPNPLYCKLSGNRYCFHFCCTYLSTKITAQPIKSPQ